jgi:carbon-monoxide dehydrogenase medium subunit
MKEYSYVAPASVGECLQILHQTERTARITAGCTNVLPNLKSNKIPDCVLVDIGGLQEIKGIQIDGQKVRIGALVTIDQLLHSPEIEQGATALWQACQRFADPLVRNRATIGGNLANASPAADSVTPLLALNACVTVESVTGGKRDIPIESFFLAPGKSVLRCDELITAISFVSEPEMKSCFLKFGLRQAMAISVINVAVALKLTGNSIADIRIALGAVSPVAMRAKQTECFLIGQEISPAVLDKAVELVKNEICPISDLRASKEYRTLMAGVLLRRAIEAVLG